MNEWAALDNVQVIHLCKRLAPVFGLFRLAQDLKELKLKTESLPCWFA